jgi:hypothetical protein
MTRKLAPMSAKNENCSTRWCGTFRICPDPGDGDEPASKLLSTT